MTTNIDKVFQIVCRLLNKTAFTAYTDFNKFAAQASLQLFNDRLKEYAVNQKISEDLRGFVKSTTLTTTTSGSSNKASLPLDYAYLLALRANDKDFNVVEPHEKGKHLSSKLLAPSVEFPLAAGYGDEYEVYPTTIKTVTLDYLKKPAVPEWKFTLIMDRPVYDSAASTDFDWPETCMNELTVRILSFYGLNMKAQDVAQYAEVKKEQGV